MSLITLQFPPWEDEGTLPPSGKRNFVAGYYPKPQYHDALMYRNRADHETFATYIEQYGTAQHFLFDDMLTLSGMASGQPPVAAVVGRWPVFQFAQNIVPSGEVQEVYVFPRFAGTTGFVYIQWSSPDTTGKNVVWGVDVQAIPVGGDFASSGAATTAICADTALADVRNQSKIAIGPVAAAGYMLGIRVYRDWESANDDPITANLHAIWVLTV